MEPQRKKISRKVMLWSEENDFFEDESRLRVNNSSSSSKGGSARKKPRMSMEYKEERSLMRQFLELLHISHDDPIAKQM